MAIFSSLYQWTMQWAAHRHAPRYLAVISFAESSFFVIPPDVMLAPMCLAKPDKAWRYALLTTLASVLGGAFGYLIGHFAFDLIEPLLQKAGYWGGYMKARQWFDTWGFWAVLLAGFSPIPYKIFTIAAGVIAMSFPVFLLASAVGRGARFFIVAGMMVLGGERMERALRRYVDILGWLVVAVAVLAYFVIKLNGSNG